MLEILKEITVWNSREQPNHTYLLGDSGRIIAYAPDHGNKIIVLKSQMKIDKRYRKFVKTNHPGLSKFLSNHKSEPGVRKFEVQSKDKKYIVSLREEEYSCTCTGFTFRGQCKHINAVAEKLQSA
jgi:hypothetical protein